MSITTIEIPPALDAKLGANIIQQMQCASGVVVLRGVGQTVWNKETYTFIQDFWCEFCEIAESRPMFITNMARGDVRSTMMTLAAVSSVPLAEPDATFGFSDLRLGGMP